MGCSDENCATASQSMVTVPACSVFIVSFLSLTLTMAPVRRSPFFRVTCSAYKAITQQHTDSRHTLILNIVILFSWVTSDVARGPCSLMVGLCFELTPGGRFWHQALTCPLAWRKGHYALYLRGGL